MLDIVASFYSQFIWLGAEGVQKNLDPMLQECCICYISPVCCASTFFGFMARPQDVECDMMVAEVGMDAFTIIFDDQEIVLSTDESGRVFIDNYPEDMLDEDLTLVELGDFPSAFYRFMKRLEEDPDDVLLEAVGDDNAKLVEVALISGADIDSFEGEPLRLAVTEETSVDIVKLLLREGANTDLLTDYDYHLLYDGQDKAKIAVLRFYDVIA